MLLQSHSDDARAGNAVAGTEAEFTRLKAENERLAAENARLVELARANEESARLQAARAASLLEWAAGNANTLGTLYRSTFWQVTAPVRVLARMLGGSPPHGLERGISLRAVAPGITGWRDAARRTARAAARRSHQLAHRVSARMRPRRSSAGEEGAEPLTIERMFGRPIGRQSAEILAPSLLIIAELSVPQCAKYRVWQKKSLVEQCGVRCIVTDWRDTGSSLSALQVCTSVVFYRTPGTTDVLALVAEAGRLGVPSRWEVDDAIFDEAIYAANGNLETLDPELRQSLLEGVRAYRKAMLKCDGAIASTPDLATAMRNSGMRDTIVIENALDAETLEIAAALHGSRSSRDDRVRITYGSGTKTHDVDFACAAAAIARLMHTHPEVELRIVGELTLPREMDGLSDRIERIPQRDFRSWLTLLADSDITLAPLEATAFNDAKSNIKYLEAAVLGVPCVCSPRANFRTAVVDSETGMLAEGDAGWFAALERLVIDPALRRRLGDAARRSVLGRYAPDRIASTQVAPFVTGLDRRTRRGLRVLIVNVFFWPRSFGGATVVAEETARVLHGREDAEVFVFTTHPTRREGDYGLRRYHKDGMPVISVAVPHIPDPIAAFDNPAIAGQFEAVLRAVEPDVVHFHSVQAIGTNIMQSCVERGVPFVVTVHDAWWLCARQFMVKPDGRYCFQRKIDLNLCRACVYGASYLERRLDLLTHRLRLAALVLAPSHSHAALYAENGLDPARLRVQANGVRAPDRARSLRTNEGRSLRFGYVGGTEAVKGYHVLREAVEALDQDNWTLTLIDNTLNLGFASMAVSEWDVRGRVSTAPSYRQEDLDDFFQGIDVLLFPSQCRESFGLTVREALIRDVWVIVTDCGGPVEDLLDGVNGTIIPMDGRYEPLRDAMADLLVKPEILDGYVNPEKHRLRSFRDQADELFELLSSVAAGERVAACTNG